MNGPPEMNAARWALVEDVLDGASNLTGAARTRYLDERCAGDDALRRDIESLLAELETDPGFLETPVWLGDPLPDETLPERIGPHRVIRLLGRGGMGQVYLAVREAPGFSQQIALKVMRRGMDGDRFIARFRNERQILASLDHPNIAGLIDVGSTDDGVPFLAMAFVDGRPILEFCDAARLDLRARIAIFRSVCDAVQHAHRNLIVHRDIKSSNILVTADGVPRLLDFGIATILQPRQSDGSTAHADVRLLTPEHAAPEQIRGDAITTACDVYGLGVLLYELLSGVHPFAAPLRSRDDIERAVLAGDAPLPGATSVDDETAARRRLDPAALRRRLRGDLDAITHAAMRLDPAARYPSVHALVDDLDRHLAGLPIRTRPASAGYRLRKFVGRNRLAVVAGTALFAVLAASTAMAVHQSRRIAEESRRVARERDKALQVRGFLLEMFGTTGPDQATGDTVTARQLLDRRAALLAQEHAEDPEMRAEMMVVLAEGYEKLGLLADAEPLARAALYTRRDLHGQDHADLVASLAVLGWLVRGRGRLEEAEELLRESVVMGRRVFQDADVRMARALNDLGVVRQDRGDLDEAANLFRESLDVRRRLRREDNLGIAITTSNLSVVLYRRNDLEGATTMAENALDLLRRTLGGDHQRTLVVQSNLAAFQSVRGDHEGSATQHRDILERRIRLFGSRHASVAYSRTMLANELVLLEDYPAAERLLVDALDVQREAGIADAAVMSTLRVLGDTRRATGRDDAALANYDEALAAARSLLGDAHSDVASLHARRATQLERLGRMDEAARAWDDALGVAERAGEDAGWGDELRAERDLFVARTGWGSG